MHLLKLHPYEKKNNTYIKVFFKIKFHIHKHVYCTQNIGYQSEKLNWKIIKHLIIKSLTDFVPDILKYKLTNLGGQKRQST